MSKETRDYMTKQKFTITKEQFEKIVAINKEGGDPVMYLSGGIPMGRSLQEKINDFWDELGKEMGFDWHTIEIIDNNNFYAEPVIKDLGTMNSWNETPPKFKICKEAGHELTVENLGRCYNKYTCEICKISWKVDSGD